MEELGDKLIPQAGRNGKAIDRDEDLPDFGRESGEARWCPDKIAEAIEATFEESFLHVSHAEGHFKLGDRRTHEFKNVGAGDRAEGVTGIFVGAAIRDNTGATACGFGIVDPLSANAILGGFIIGEVGDSQTFDEGVFSG